MRVLLLSNEINYLMEGSLLFLIKLGLVIHALNIFNLKMSLLRSLEKFKSKIMRFCAQDF